MARVVVVIQEGSQCMIEHRKLSCPNFFGCEAIGGVDSSTGQGSGCRRSPARTHRECVENFRSPYGSASMSAITGIASVSTHCLRKRRVPTSGCPFAVIIAQGYLQGTRSPDVENSIQVFPQGLHDVRKLHAKNCMYGIWKSCGVVQAAHLL